MELSAVAVGPRAGYPRLARSPVTKADPDDDLTGTWSVTCFFVHRTGRRSGLTRTLLAGAVDYAWRGGVRVVVGCPVDPAGRKTGSGELYHGTLGLVTGAGISVVRRGAPRRALVRLDVA